MLCKYALLCILSVLWRFLVRVCACLHRKPQHHQEKSSSTSLHEALHFLPTILTQIPLLRLPLIHIPKLFYNNFLH